MKKKRELLSKQRERMCCHYCGCQSMDVLRHTYKNLDYSQMLADDSRHSHNDRLITSISIVCSNCEREIISLMIAGSGFKV